jgi:hypothetical protein
MQGDVRLCERTHAQIMMRSDTSLATGVAEMDNETKSLTLSWLYVRTYVHVCMCAGAAGVRLPSRVQRRPQAHQGAA